MTNSFEIKEGSIFGPWRAVVNAAAGASGSIHDESVAKNIGIRGGAVTGTNHLDVFIPVLLEAFGQRWFEQGSMSIFYTFMTTDREEVRGVVGVPPEGVKDAQVDARLEMHDGKIVGQGTVSVGKLSEPTYIGAIEMKTNGEAPRVFTNIKVGHKMGPYDVRITQEQVDRRLAVTTDPIDWYKGSSPWGNSVLPPQTMHDALQLIYRPDAIPERTDKTAVGFYGATELRNINGPIMVDIPYRVYGEVVYIGVTAKTEFYWYDSFLDDLGGKRIAEMRKMIRVMKSSSALWR